jgi:hypothetical protein
MELGHGFNLTMIRWTLDHDSLKWRLFDDLQSVTHPKAIPPHERLTKKFLTCTCTLGHSIEHVTMKYNRAFIYLLSEISFVLLFSMFSRGDLKIF